MKMDFEQAMEKRSDLMAELNSEILKTAENGTFEVSPRIIELKDKILRLEEDFNLPSFDYMED